jgi:integrase
MPIYPRNGKFQVSVGSGKTRFRQDCDTREEAEQVELREMVRRKGSNLILVPKSEKHIPTFKELLRECEKDREMWAIKSRGNTLVRAYTWMEYIGEDTLITDINSRMLKDALAEMGEDHEWTAGGTFNSHISVIGQILRKAVEWDYLDRLPIIPKSRRVHHRAGWMDFDLEQEFLLACDKFGYEDFKQFCIVGMDTGFRRKELSALTAKHYKDDVLHVFKEDSKNGKPRKVPVTDRVKAIIENRIETRSGRLFEGLGTTTIWYYWRRIREALGRVDDQDFVFHMLRHTCASRLAMQDKSAMFIMQWMGHSNITTTQIYMHLAPSKMGEGKTALEDYIKNNRPKLKVVPRKIA